LSEVSNSNPETKGLDWQRIAKRIRVPLGFVFAALYVVLAKPTVLSIVVGGALALVGVLIRALASGHVRKNEQLAISGPYAYTRNPLYLGSIVIGIGFAVAALRWEIAVVLAVMFVVIYLPVIRGEEAWLGTHFTEYAEYAQQVPRLLPRLTPAAISKGETGSFSRELYLKHREYNALIGSLAVIAVLVAKLVWMVR
jgi:protein-S-isoprenylcysteine O-methyltransferase Ste14